MRYTWVKRDKYQKAGKQLDKDSTVQIAEKTVDVALALLEETDEFINISKYEPEEETLYIRDSPIVQIESSDGIIKAIAPDIRGEMKSGITIWIEVKDKSQRAFYPDTGCDIHQFIGFWNINKYLKEPVLMMFIDPSPEDIGFPPKLKGSKKTDYIQRLKKFRIGEVPVFYGNWLSVLSKYEVATQYPLCCHERSRTIPMQIVYFEISKMKRLGASREIQTLLKDAQIYAEMPTFQLFDKNENKVVNDSSFYFHGGS
ncbi:MAG: hypothetical protein KKA79_06445 [Nanoarchaeota archaeon]|nr:hypothetical protein [Nanoarchaeota archaeon]